MPIYNVQIQLTIQDTMEIQANSHDEATDIAYEEAKQQFEDGLEIFTELDDD